MTSLSSCPVISKAAQQPANSLYARSLAMALVPSLWVAGNLAAQVVPERAADTAPDASAVSVAAPDKEIVQLEPFEVKGDREVTALASPKFTQPLVDTPQTIAVIPREVFNQQGASTLSDVLRNTPGITFTAGEGGNVASGDTFTMRGFDTSGSLFIDGVRDSGAYRRDVYNTEQVEIAKGPAGADNGRGGTSGYVNMVTKTPQLESFATGTASYGKADHGGEAEKRVSLDYNQAIEKSPVKGTAFRLNLVTEDSGIPGRDQAENTGYGIAPSLAFGLGTPTRVKIAAAYNRQNDLPDSGLPAVALPAGEAQLYSDPIGASTTLKPYTSPFGSIDQSNFYGFADADYEEVTNRSLLFRVEHDLNPDLKLSNQTKFVDTEKDSLTSYIQSGTSFNPATGLVTPRRLRVQPDNEITSNQTNLTTTFDTADIEHDLSLGLDLSHETQFAPTWTAVNGPTQSLTNPDTHKAITAAQIPTLAANDPYTAARIDTAALYAFDTLHLTEKLLFNASGRLEHYDSEYSSRAAATAAIPKPPTVNLDVADTLFSWKTGLVFKPRPEGSLYVAYGTGFTPPGTNFTFSTTPGNANNPATEPQESDNAEVGVKWDFFKSRLSTSLAFYRSQNKNVPVNIGTAAAPVIVYDTAQISEGVEFGVSGKITPEWLVFGGIGYIETETDSPHTAATDGASLRYTPRVSGSLWTTYALPFKVTVGGGAQYTETVTRSTTSIATGSSTNTTEGISAVTVPDTLLFNALVAYEVNKHLTLRLNVDNVFDEFSYRLNNNGGRYYPSAPRTYTLSADFTF